MKEVEYKDEEGRKFRVTIPEGFEDSPEYGIRIGPPDLEGLGLSIDYEVRLNNQLFDRKLFTPADVRHRPAEIRAALMAVLKLDVLKILALYKEV